MEVLVFENGSHIKADALRKAFPDLTIHGTADITEALRMGANDEVLAALAHHVTDPLLEAMPKLRWIAALTTGTAFGSLVLSSHPGTASMGKLLALSLFFTLVAAFFVVPAFLGPRP